MNRLRHEGGLSYGTRSSLSASSRDDRGSFRGNAICAPQNAQKAITAMRDELQNWLHQGLTAEELREAKKSYALKFESSLANERYLLGKLVSGLELDRTLQFEADLVEKIQNLTQDDIRAALHEVFGDAKMVELMAGDFSKVDKEEIQAAAPAAEHTQIGL
jgi:zinc protease